MEQFIRAVEIAEGLSKNGKEVTIYLSSPEEAKEVYEFLEEIYESCLEEYD